MRRSIGEGGTIVRISYNVHSGRRPISSDESLPAFRLVRSPRSSTVDEKPGRLEWTVLLCQVQGVYLYMSIVAIWQEVQTKSTRLLDVVGYSRRLT
jgi:hypothetical protein